MQNSHITLRDWYDIFLAIFFILWVVGIYAFSRISVRHIEREMKKGGGGAPEWDKGIGIRLSMYVMTIIRNKVNAVTLFDEQAVLKHTRKVDRYLAVSLQITTIILFLLGFLGYFIFGNTPH